MKRTQMAVLGLVLGLAGLFYATGSAWTAQQEKGKSCCADCCCCAKSDAKAEAKTDGMACPMKHKKS